METGTIGAVLIALWFVFWLIYCHNRAILARNSLYDEYVHGAFMSLTGIRINEKVLSGKHWKHMWRLFFFMDTKKLYKDLAKQ